MKKLGYKFEEVDPNRWAKNMLCPKCKEERTDLNYWYSGNVTYQGTCERCGWYDGGKWREHLNKALTQ